MKREFFKHGVVYGAANLISSAGNVLLVPIYTRALLPRDYGVVDYMTVVQLLIQLVAGLEITQGIARFYAAAKDEDERRAYASTGLWFMLASFLLVCTAIYGAARAWNVSSLTVGVPSGVFGLALISVYARILFYALQSQARWQLRADLYSVASIIAVTASVGSVSYLLLVDRRGLPGVFAGLSIGYGLACVFCLITLRHTYRRTFDASKLRQMLAFSLPLTASSLALLLSNYGDRIVLKSSLGFHDLGVYGIGARFAAIVTLAINGFQLGAAPLVYQHYARPDTPAALGQLMRLFLCAGLIAVAALAAFSTEIVRVFATPEYAAASRVVPVLAFAMVMANMYIFVPGLTLRNMTARFAVVNIVNASVALLLLAGFVRAFGITGAAIAVLCSSTVGFLLHALCSQSVYTIPIAWGRLMAGMTITTVAIGTTWAIAAESGFSLALRTLLFAVVSVVLAAVLSTRNERATAQRLAMSVASWSWSRA